MPEKTTYTRKIPEPQAWQNTHRQDAPSISRVVPSSPREMTKIKIPEVSQSQPRAISITPPKQSEKMERLPETVQISIPKQVKAPNTLKPTVKPNQSLKISSIPKISSISNELSRSSTMSIKPLTMPKQEKPNINNHIVPLTSELLRMLKLQRESGDVERYILVQAANRIAGLNAIDDPSRKNKPLLQKQIRKLASLYNEAVLNPTHTLEEMKQIVNDEKFANKNVLDYIKDGWSALMAKLPSKERAKEKAGDWIKEAAFIATIPAIATGLQANGKSWKENGAEALNTIVHKIWGITAPTTLQNIFSFGKVQNISKDDLLNWKNYSDGNVINRFNDAVNATNERVWDLFGLVDNGTTPSAIQNRKLNYIKASSLPASDIVKAVQYETSRDLVSRLIQKLPYRVGEIGINVPYIEEQWQRSMMKRASPQILNFIEDLRSLGHDPNRIVKLSPPASIPKPTINALKMPNELGVPQINAKFTVEPTIDYEAIDKLMKTEGSRRSMEYAARADNEYKHALKRLDIARRDLKEISSKYDVAKSKYDESFERYNKISELGGGHDSHEIELLNLERNNYKLYEESKERATAKLQEAEKSYKTARDHAFWRMIDANRNALYDDDENTKEFDDAAKELFDAKYNGLDPSMIEKALNEQVSQKVALSKEAEIIEKKLETPKYLAQGTLNWPIDSKNNLTAKGIRVLGDSGKAYEIGFDTNKEYFDKIADNPKQVMQYMQALEKRGNYKLPTWVEDVFSKPKSKIEPAVALNRLGKMTTGDGTVDYIMLISSVLDKVPAEHQSAIGSYSDDPDGMKYFFNRANQMKGVYNGRVKLAREKPEIVGAPSFDPGKKMALVNELKDVKSQISDKDEEIKRWKTKSQVLTNAQEKMNKIIENRVKEKKKKVPYSKLPDKYGGEPVVGGSGMDSPQKQDFNESVVRKEPESKPEPTQWKELGMGLLGLASTFGILGLGAKVSEWVGKPEIANLVQQLNDPKYIEMNPAKNSMLVNAPRFSYADVSENALLSGYSKNDLRNIVQNYFIKTNQSAKLPQSNQSAKLPQSNKNNKVPTSSEMASSSEMSSLNQNTSEEQKSNVPNVNYPNKSEAALNLETNNNNALHPPQYNKEDEKKEKLLAKSTEEEEINSRSKKTDDNPVINNPRDDESIYIPPQIVEEQNIQPRPSYVRNVTDQVANAIGVNLSSETAQFINKATDVAANTYNNVKGGISKAKDTFEKIFGKSKPNQSTSKTNQSTTSKTSQSNTSESSQQLFDNPKATKEEKRRQEIARKAMQDTMNRKKSNVDKTMTEMRFDPRDLNTYKVNK